MMHEMGQDVKGAPQCLRCGFTLIELLIVISILGLVIGTIGACLAAGIRVWDQAQSFNRLESEAVIGLELMERDIRNSLTVYGIGFEGTESSVQFPGFVSIEGAARVGVIEYSLDEARRAIVRTESQWPSGELRREQIMPYVDALTLTYAKETASEGAESGFQNMGSTVTNFPDLVEISLSLSNGERTVDMVRRVLMPIRGR